MSRKDPDVQAAEQVEVLRALVREAREATKDLRAAMKDFENLIVHKSDDIFERNSRDSFIQLGRAVERSFHTIESNAKQCFEQGINRCIDAIESAATTIEKSPPATIAENIRAIQAAFMQDSDSMMSKMGDALDWHRRAGIFLSRHDPRAPERRYKR